MPRGSHLTPEHQRHARSYVRRESLQAAGRKGFQRTAELHGAELGHRHAREWRLAHPSAPEREVMRILADLAAPAYEREYQPFGDVHTVDFAWPHLLLAIEVDGRVHRVAELDPTRESRDRGKREALREAGWQLLVLSDLELPDAAPRIARFLGLEQPTTESEAADV